MTATIEAYQVSRGLDMFEKIATALRLRARRKELKRTVKKWYRDGGEDHLRYAFDLDSSSMVLDIGGYKGNWADRIFERYGCHIHVFEPVRTYYDDITKRFAHNPKIQAHNFGLGASTRQERISLSGEASSIKVGVDDQNCELARIEDVDAFLTRARIEQIDLAKINTEGGEFEILPRLIETGRIANIRNIVVQFHDFHAEADRDMADIQSQLSRTHEPIFQYRFVWEHWKRKS